MVVINEIEILDTEQAAKFLHVSTKCLENWRLLNKGPVFIRYSRGAVRYRRTDLLAYLDACASTASKRKG